MSEPSATPAPRSAIADALAPGRHGADGGTPVSITERRLSIVQVTTRRGQEAHLASAVVAAFGSEPPGPGRALLQGGVATIWIGPGTWLVTEPWRREGALAERIAAVLGRTASIVDQTHGKAAIRLSGARARDVLARGCRIDLHPRVFGPGRAATTPIAHVGTTLLQIDDVPTFDLIVPATFAESFFGWLCEAAAGIGYEVVGT